MTGCRDHSLRTNPQVRQTRHRFLVSLQWPRTLRHLPVPRSAPSPRFPHATGPADRASIAWHSQPSESNRQSLGHHDQIAPTAPHPLPWQPSRHAEPQSRRHHNRAPEGFRAEIHPQHAPEPENPAHAPWHSTRLSRCGRTGHVRRPDRRNPVQTAPALRSTATPVFSGTCRPEAYATQVADENWQFA